MPLIKPRTTNKPAASGAARGASSAPRFQYKPRSAEEVRERAMRNIGGRDSFFAQDVQFFTPKKGENNVRFLPPPPNANWGHYGLTLFVHYGIGADQSAYLCHARMKDDYCPLCEERDRAASVGEEELADNLKPRERVACFVIDRSQESKGPLLWNIPAGLDKDISKLCLDPKTGEAIFVDHPEEGFDFAFEREGEGLKTKYKGLQFARKSSPLADDPEVVEKWLDYIVEHRVDECLVFHEPDYIAKVYEGQPPAAARGEEEQPKGNKKGAREKSTQEENDKPSKARIQPRGAKKPEAEPAPEDSPPLWEDLEALDEDGLAEIVEAEKMDVPKDGFESIEALRDFVAEGLGIEKPEPEAEPEAPSAGAKGSWRDRLKKLQGKK